MLLLLGENWKTFMPPWSKPSLPYVCYASWFTHYTHTVYTDISDCRNREDLATVILYMSPYAYSDDSHCAVTA